MSQSNETEVEWVKEKSWEEFSKSGMLWWMNRILHTFGWSICVKKQEGEIVGVFPARVKFRGFSANSEVEGYKKVSKFMSENHEELVKESEM